MASTSLVKVNSVAHRGIDTVGVVVEVNISARGFPSFDIVGLPSKAVAESKERVRAAIINSGFSFPSKKITVNLAPADIPKNGAVYDLPIAVGLLAGFLDLKVPETSLFYGEVSLDGTLRNSKGVFLLGIFAVENGFTEAFVPQGNAHELASFDAVRPVPTDSLSSLCAHLSGLNKITSFTQEVLGDSSSDIGFEHTFDEVLGQPLAKRALTVCAAGGHNIMLYGPPGTGKTMLARSLPSILPPMCREEQLEVTRIYSCIGELQDSVLTKRPFRMPHHSVSNAGFVGGGSIPKPGEISLAHRGVLFLDEFPEFSRLSIEALRQPLEDGVITISRSGGNVRFPANFILIVACNPCPCGYYGHKTKECVCTEYQIRQYKKKVSGPILDRLDLCVPVDSVRTKELGNFSKKERAPTAGTQSRDFAKKVLKARKTQGSRYKDYGILTNSEATNVILGETCNLSRDAKRLLNMATTGFNLSARTYFKIIKISRTIADLEGASDILKKHVAEALQYKNAWSK